MKSAKEWHDEFRPYEHRVMEFEKQITYLRYDHDLLLKGYKFHFAIDSYDTIRHLFPFAGSATFHIKRSSPNEFFSLFSREQIALAFIFHGFAEQLILFPPHLNELYYFMDIERRKSINDAQAAMVMGRDQFERALKKTIQESEAFREEKPIQSIQALLSDLDHQTLLDLSEEHSKSLLALTQLDLRILHGPGINLLSKLLNKNRIVSVEKATKGFTINEELLLDNYPERRKTLLEFQSKKQAAGATINDIFALEYLIQINNYGVLNEPKELVLFIGSSRPLLKSLEKLGKFGIPGLPDDYNFVRCPGFWLTYLMMTQGFFYEKQTGHSLENQRKAEMLFHKRTKEEIDTIAEAINQFHGAIAAFKEVEKTGSVASAKRDYFLRAGNILDTVKSRLNNWENLRLLLNKGLVSQLVKDASLHSRDSLKGLIDWLNILQDRLFSIRLENRILGILNDVNRATNETKRLIHTQKIASPFIRDLFGFEDDEGEAILSVRRYDRYISGEEYQVQFANKDIRSFAQAVKALGKKPSATELLKVTKEIRSLAVPKENQHEIHLFWAAFYFSIAHYKEAFAELERGKELAENHKGSDYALLATLIHRMQGDEDRAEKVCRQALENHPRDPRLNREMGGILRIKGNCASAKRKRGIFEKAEEHYRIAIDKAPNKAFLLESMAALAFTLQLSGRQEDILHASKLLEDYKKCSEGMKKKHARYWWVTAVFHIMQAESNPADREKVLTLTKKAQKCITSGLRVDSSLRWGQLEKRIDLLTTNPASVKN